MSVKTLVIDDNAVTGMDDQTIFKVAWDHDIHIPRLCHIGALSEAGSCRLCMVEVEGQKKLQAACSTLVEEGMVVHTDTPRLRSYRRMIVELLLAERNHVCAVCVADEACELQNLALSLGIGHIRYRYRFPPLPVDISHELFGLDHNRCILCTRCVRVCAEVEGAKVWEVSARGINSRLVSDLSGLWGESEACTSCGKCVQVCPTGALAEKGLSVEEMAKRNENIKWLAVKRAVRV